MQKSNPKLGPTLLIIIGCSTCILVSIIMLCVGSFVYSLAYTEQSIVCERDLTDDLRLRITYNKSFENTTDYYYFQYKGGEWTRFFFPDLLYNEQEVVWGKRLDLKSKDRCNLMPVDEELGILIIGNVLYSYDGGETIYDAFAQVRETDTIWDLVEAEGIKIDAREHYPLQYKNGDLFLKVKIYEFQDKSKNITFEYIKNSEFSDWQLDEYY